MRTGQWAWVVYLAFGSLVAVGYYVVVHSDGDAVMRVVLYSMVSTSSAIAVLYGCYRHRPKPIWPWLLLGLSEVVYAAADTSFYLSHYILDYTEFPKLSDLFYLSHYPLVVAGLVLLIRLRTPGGDLPALLDAALIAVVAGMLSWLYILAPTAHAEVPSLAKAASLAYPMMDLAMLAVAMRLILGRGRRPMAFILLSTNLLAFLTADSIYVIQQLLGTYQAGNFLDAIWLAGNLALGAAALHPTMSSVGKPADRPDPGPSALRITVLCAFALVAPATLMVQYFRGSVGDIPVVAVACALLFLLTIARMAGLVAQHRRIAITDVLTGLSTRRYFEAQLNYELSRARRADSSLAVLIADVDDFKLINDTYGHPGGDRVLIEIANRLRSGVRHTDVLARYGGEEFALLVRGASADEPMVIAERLRRKVNSSPIMVGDSTWVEVTVSVGTATFPMHGDTPDQLVLTADRALYAAKSHKRSRTVPTTPEGIDPADTTEVVSYLRHLADLVDGWLSDPEHSRTVSRWAELTAIELGYGPEITRCAALAGRLHDVGKILIPKEIWTKTGSLTMAEWQQIRRHPDEGYQLMRTVPGLAEIAQVIRQHRERVDGSGYPDQLTGDEIRIEARIIAVCDAWATMLAGRPYHTARSETQALDELRRCRGSQFDPAVTDAFLRLYRAGQLSALARPAPDGGAPTG